MIDKSIKVNIKIQHEDFDISKETQKLHDSELRWEGRMILPR